MTTLLILADDLTGALDTGVQIAQLQVNTQVRLYAGPDTLRSAEEAEVLVIDIVGILSKIYKYGSFAYIGGGFSSSGIHNILEAAIYGCPVMFGPHYDKFQEAKDLITLGGAFSVSSAPELSALLEKWLLDPGTVEKPSLVCTQYVESHLGASDTIMDRIFKNV